MNCELTKSNLRTAWRSIVRMRTYSFINVVGLVVSLTGAIIIARYVHQELTVDHYVPQLERTFLLTNVNKEHNVGHTDAVNHNSADNWQDPMADPAVECFTRFTCIYGGLGVKTDDRMHKARAIAVDSMFLRILPRDVLAGTAEMKNPTDVVVTKDFADRLWPGEHPIGKTLEHDGNVLSVVGMVGAASTKCNFDFELLVNPELKRFMYVGWSLIRLKEGEDWTAYNKRQLLFTETYRGGGSYDHHFQLFPLAKAYFDAPLEDYSQGADRYFVKGDRQSMNYLIAGATMLFAVGLFNFINIFAIVMQRRRKGMLVRKVFGATTAKLFGQIYTENVLIALIAVVLSWGIIAVASPAMVRYYNLSQLPSPSFDILLSLAIVLFFPLVITLLSMRSISGPIKSSPSGKSEGALSRRLSLGLQYVISFFMLVVSSYSIHQLHYLLTADMGYRTEDIIWFDLLPESHNMNASDMTHEEYEERMRKDGLFREQAGEALRRVNESPLIVKACFLRNKRVSLTGGKSTVEDWGLRAKRADQDDSCFKNLAQMSIEAEALDIYGLKLLEGDLPDAEQDRFWDYRIFLSQSAKKTLGIENIASEQVQFEKRLWWGMDENGNFQTDNPPYTVVGVYDDFSLTHLASQDMPFIVEITGPGIYDEYTYFLAHYQHGKRRETLAFLQGIFEELNGAGSVMPYKLIEDEIAEIYAADARTARIYTTFALLAILVSCMGLFGISLYDVQRHRREIAIRRVHGAKVQDIFRLISRRYLVALGIAVAVGTPLALYALHYYIMGYAHHVPLTPWYFLGTALLMLLLTLATIWWQVRRATREAPSKVIKSE